MPLFSHGYKTRPAPEGDGLELYRYKSRNKQAVLPDHIVSITENAFADNDSLESIEIPNSVQFIGPGAFKNCRSLHTVVFETPRTLPLSLGSYAFAGCGDLPAISFQGVIANLPYGLFHGCYRLSDVTLPDGLVDADRAKNDSFEGVFAGCDALKRITTPEGMLVGPAYLYARTQRNVPEFTILDGVTQIEPEAFAGCTRLTSLHIPDTVLKVGSRSFWGCTALQRIRIPELLTLPHDAFLDCEPSFIHRHILPHMNMVWENTGALEAFWFLIEQNQPGLTRPYIDLVFEHMELLAYVDYILGQHGVTQTHIDCLRRILSVGLTRTEHAQADGQLIYTLDGADSRRAVQTLIALGDPVSQYFLHRVLRIPPVMAPSGIPQDTREVVGYDYAAEKERILEYFKRLGNPEIDRSVFGVEAT